KEIGVARAAPVFGFEPRHCRGSRVLDRHDPGDHFGRRPVLVDQRAELGQGPIDRLAIVAAADMGGLEKRIAHERAVAGARAVDIGLERRCDRLVDGEARVLVGFGDALAHPIAPWNVAVDGSDYAAGRSGTSWRIPLEWDPPAQ